MILGSIFVQDWSQLRRCGENLLSTPKFSIFIPLAPIKKMSTKTEHYTVRAADKVRRMGIFDGNEPEFLKPEFEIPGSGGITFRARQFLDQPFADLKGLLGEKIFDQIVEDQGYITPQGPWATWTGSENLALYYFIHRFADADFESVVLVGFGEFQPGRYIINVEGIWDIEGLNTQGEA